MVVKRGRAAQGADGHFLYGMPYILWDNIPRGSQISCPHIERAAPQPTIPIVGSASPRYPQPPPRPSISSPAIISGRRAIWPRAACIVRLEVNRADPENREFKHPDPLDWTDATPRRDPGGALHHPARKSPDQEGARRTGQTRFKMWWRLVGSAVEHAAGRSGEELSFKTLFLAREEDDEELNLTRRGAGGPVGPCGRRTHSRP